MSVKVVEEALYARLTGDATLMSLVGQGVWNTDRPLEENLDFSQPLTWVYFVVERGGDTNDATGERFKEIIVRVMACAHFTLSLTDALTIDERLDALLTGWEPTLSGWPNVWGFDREETMQVIVTGEDDAVLEWQAGATYSLGYGTG